MYHTTLKSFRNNIDLVFIFAQIKLSEGVEELRDVSFHKQKPQRGQRREKKALYKHVGKYLKFSADMANE